MNADVMLENIGYKLCEESKKYLRYKTEAFRSYEGNFIDFDLKNKRFRLSSVSSQNNRHVRYATMEELKAITKKCEELGWPNE